MRAAPVAGALALAAAALAGCGGLPPRPATLPERVELAEVPFHPQLAWQCGPAALATVLQHAGVEVTPEALVPQVWLPGRRGSLQAELVAATRRHQRVPYVLAPDPAALRTELAAGNPVLVLQNFGSRRSPQWHYAVAIGYEPGRVLLRSGITERERMREARFAGTWARGEHWALVVPSPGTLPATAEPARWLAAASGLEAIGLPAAAAVAYETAVRRWPAAAGAWLGLGNARAALDDARGAEAAFTRAAVSVAANDAADDAANDAANDAVIAAAALNNLGVLLARRGCGAAARATWSRAMAIAARSQLASAVAGSRAEVEAAGDGGVDCPVP